MIGDRIKQLRELSSLTQSDLAKKLGITRSSVNAWEMGLSAPSTQYLIELARLFHVATDYILGLERQLTISVEEYSDSERQALFSLVRTFEENEKIRLLAERIGEIPPQELEKYGIDLRAYKIEDDARTGEPPKTPNSASRRR